MPSVSAFEGAVLVADISGFTALTEQLSRAEIGVELLTKCINDFFARVSASATAIEFYVTQLRNPDHTIYAVGRSGLILCEPAALNSSHTLCR